MSAQDQALYLNAIPLLALAVLYGLAAFLLLPEIWRQRRRIRGVELAIALVFPSVGVASGLVGALALDERRPLASHSWLVFTAIVLALAPAIAVLASGRDRGLLLTGARRAQEAEEEGAARARERAALNAFAAALARAPDVESVGRLLVDEAIRLVGVDFASLTIVTEEGAEATGVVARDRSGWLDWWRGYRVDLRHEPSGIASAAYEAAPVAVYDLSVSGVVNRALRDRLKAQSAAWIPCVSGERVIGVLAVATQRERRAFGQEELSVLQALAGEAALALDRERSAAALARALEREQLVSRIGHDLRSELDLPSLLAVAAAETGAALGADACVVRLREGSEALEVAAAWRLDGAEPGEEPPAVLAELAARQRRTLTVGPGGVSDGIDEAAAAALGDAGVLSALATPIVVGGDVLGALEAHRPAESAWGRDEVDVAEAVVREIGLAVQTARLLDQNAARLRTQTALLGAAQALGGELHPVAVLERLVAELAALVGADAADFYVLDRGRGVLRCAAVYGLPSDVLGFEFAADEGLAARALQEGKGALTSGYGDETARVAHPAYANFTNAMVAPVAWGGEARGVLGVGTRPGGRTFTDADLDVVQTFAGMAALALRNAEELEERSRQARVQRGFYSIASVLAQPLALAGTLEALARAAAEALGGEWAAVLAPEPDGLRLAGSTDLPDPLRDVLAQGLGASAPALAEAATASRILAAPEVALDERFGDAWRRLAQETGFRSLIAVPVRAGRDDDAPGLALVFFADARQFSDDDVELAQHLAGAARGALERSALYEEERRARSLAQQLARTGSLLATELDPAAVLDEVVRQAPLLLGVDTCVIRVVDGDELVVSAAEGAGAEDALGARSPASGWLAGDVAQSHAPLALADAAADRRYLGADPVLASGYRAFLGVPLLGPEGSLLGVLSVYARRAKTWRSEEIEALQALAANASAALSNAELYQRVALEKERSFAILANIADGIVAVDREGRVVLWNHAAEEITGVPAEEALGRPPADALGRDLATADGGPGDRLVPVLRGGEEVWLSVTEAVMRDPAGAVAGRIFAFRDISADRIVEQMKSDFVSSVSQELRRPLTSIYGFAETLLRRDVLFGEDDRTTFLGYIASESERLSAIVDALLNVARLDTGDLQVSVEPTDVASLVGRSVPEPGEGEPDAGPRFVVDLPPGPLSAEADPEKLRLVLANLVDNAVKFSPPDGTVTVSARRRGETVEVSVQDEGPGVPAAEQERIFRKFYRGEPGGARPAGGTGLGLFIARGLVSAMGGRLWVESSEGEGARFVFELPAAEGAAEPALAGAQD